METMIEFTTKSYYLAYQTIQNKDFKVRKFYGDSISIYLSPLITLAAFSCELALKGQIFSESGRMIHSHDYVRLFNNLSHKLQNQIVERTISLYNLKSTIFKSSDRLDSDLFYKQLEKHKNTFIEWRYLYENNSSADLDFLEAFMFCLNDCDNDYEDYAKQQYNKEQSLIENSINQYRQKNIDKNQIEVDGYILWDYQLQCLNCGYIHSASGDNVWDKKCPKCLVK